MKTLTFHQLIREMNKPVNKIPKEVLKNVEKPMSFAEKREAIRLYKKNKKETV